ASRRYPTIELVLQILHPAIHDLGAGRAAFEAGAPLLTHQLVSLGDEAQENDALPLRSVRVDDRIVGFLLGSDQPAGSLTGVLTQPQGAVHWDQLTIDDEHLTQMQALAMWFS